MVHQKALVFLSSSTTSYSCSSIAHSHNTNFRLATSISPQSPKALDRDVRCDGEPHKEGERVSQAKELQQLQEIEEDVITAPRTRSAIFACMEQDPFGYLDQDSSEGQGHGHGHGQGLGQGQTRTTRTQKGAGGPSTLKSTRASESRGAGVSRSEAGIDRSTNSPTRKNDGPKNTCSMQ